MCGKGEDKSMEDIVEIFVGDDLSRFIRMVVNPHHVWNPRASVQNSQKWIDIVVSNRLMIEHCREVR